ncbi:DUF4263 domain-containing protein [Patescibacteria group bacterium]|nr:DUF4263 domain-containing protein [Patescibacteria group bacterium]
MADANPKQDFPGGIGVPPDAVDYFEHKKSTRTYVSKRITTTPRIPGEEPKRLRIVSKVIDSDESWAEAIQKGELVLRITSGGRQEIKATVNEDTRGISVLTIQRYSKREGQPDKPIRENFSFIGGEIKKLKDFIDSIQYVDFPDGKKRVEDSELKRVREFLSENPDVDLLIEMAQQNITKADVVTIAYRKEQLEIFSKLLNDDDFFNRKKVEWKQARDEDVWQYFFEQNHWIFGYGLSYIFNTPLEGKKLEQVVRGSDVTHAGKRADGVLKTRGIINSLCLAEIKTHKTTLLKQISKAYRTECWQVSDELNGGIIQSHKTAQSTLENIGSMLPTTTEDGTPTGETVFAYQPRSILIVGCLEEFMSDNGVNKEKFSSFELFRKNITNPEIITFDELYERAIFIVQNNEESQIMAAHESEEGDSVTLDVTSNSPIENDIVKVAYGSDVKAEDLPF